jgi:hypothetical protein
MLVGKDVPWQVNSTGKSRSSPRPRAVRAVHTRCGSLKRVPTSSRSTCALIDSVAYPLGTPEDLDETVDLVEKTGRRIVAEHGDVRDFSRVKAAVANGVAELGRLAGTRGGTSRASRCRSAAGITVN